MWFDILSISFMFWHSTKNELLRAMFWIWQTLPFLHHFPVHWLTKTQVRFEILPFHPQQTPFIRRCPFHFHPPPLIPAASIPSAALNVSIRCPVHMKDTCQILATEMSLFHLTASKINLHSIFYELYNCKSRRYTREYSLSKMK